jgi:hypothetical protein
VRRDLHVPLQHLDGWDGSSRLQEHAPLRELDRVKIGIESAGTRVVTLRVSPGAMQSIQLTAPQIQHRVPRIFRDRARHRRDLLGQRFVCVQRQGKQEGDQKAAHGH